MVKKVSKETLANLAKGRAILAKKLKTKAPKVKKVK